MNQITDLLWPLLLFALIALWLQLSRARDRAVNEARRLCQQHGLQLLDDSIGLRGLRLRRRLGQLRWERCYGFEVSIDGDDREPSQLWMIGEQLCGFSLPTIRTRDDTFASFPNEAPHQRLPHMPAHMPDSNQPPDNVVQLRPRPRDSGKSRS